MININPANKDSNDQLKQATKNQQSQNNVPPVIVSENQYNRKLYAGNLEDLVPSSLDIKMGNEENQDMDHESSSRYKMRDQDGNPENSKNNDQNNEKEKY